MSLIKSLSAAVLVTCARLNLTDVDKSSDKTESGH